MKFRRRQRWLRRFAFAFAFGTAVFAGKMSPAAWAVPDEGGAGSTSVTAGGWSGAVDAETGIPASAGIPQGNEQFVNGEDVQVIPYLSHGILTQEEASRVAAEAIHDPYLTDIYVRQGESLGGPDGDEIAFRNSVESQAAPSGDELAFRNAIASQSASTGDELAWANAVVAAADSLHDPLGAERGEAVKTQQAAEPFIPGVTDFPKPETAATRPDDQATRFSGPENPPVISYLSQGMAADGEVGARPDDRADRFTPADGVSPTPVEVSSGTDWDSAMTFGIGAVVLALALGLGLGYLRRPRLAL